MNAIRLILLVLAFLLFMLSTFGIGGAPEIGTPRRVNLLCAGLACWVLAELIPILTHLGS